MSRVELAPCDDDGRRLGPHDVDALTYVPGGRWERLLQALADDGDLTRTEMLNRTWNGRHSRNVERRKIWRALGAMQELHWVALDRRGVFTLTPLGRAVLQDGCAV